jgi:hypothetical protein
LQGRTSADDLNDAIADLKAMLDCHGQRYAFDDDVGAAGAGVEVLVEIAAGCLPGLSFQQRHLPGTAAGMITFEAGAGHSRCGVYGANGCSGRRPQIDLNDSGHGVFWLCPG